MTPRPAIVCGIDDSVHGRAAAGMAEALAERLDMSLVFVHAMAPAVHREAGAERGELPTFGALWRRERQAAKRLAEEVRDRTAARSARIEIRKGSAARSIAAVAADEGAGLVVVGSRGLGAVGAAVLGSVTTALIRVAPCPVVVVPPAFAESGATPLAGEGVVCGVENADDAGCARVAQRLAAPLGARLTLAHVLAGDGPAAGLMPPAPVPVPPVAGGLSREDAARAALGEIRRRLPGDVAAELELARGHVGEALVRLAVARDAMLVVVGSRRWRGPLGGALRRSVSRHLVCAGRRPVVLCPPQGG